MSAEKCYVCVHVFAAVRPVLYACRDDGDLVFACGGDDHRQDAADWKVVHQGHLLSGDTALADAAGLLDDGEEMERSAVGHPWARRPIS